MRYGNSLQGETYDFILFGVGREMDVLCSWWVSC